MMWRNIILSVNLSLSSTTQLSLEFNYFGFSKAVSPQRSLSKGEKAEHPQTRADGGHIMGDSHLWDPQRPNFHCVDINKKKRYVTVLSFPQPAKGRWVSRCILVLREKTTRWLHPGSVTLASPAGRPSVPGSAVSWGIVKKQRPLESASCPWRASRVCRKAWGHSFHLHLTDSPEGLSF